MQKQEKRTHIIAIRLTEEEKATIEKHAQDAKRTASDFSRYAIMTYIEILKKTK